MALLTVTESKTDRLETTFSGDYAGKRYELTYNRTTKSWFWVNEGSTSLTRTEILYKVIPGLEKRMAEA